MVLTVRCWVGSHTGGKGWGIQRELDGLERWDRVNLMKFNKAKDEILPLGWGDPQHNSRLGDEWTSPEQKDLGYWWMRSSTGVTPSVMRES